MKQRLTWRRPVPMLVLLAAIALVGMASAGGGGYSIENGTVAGGGSINANGCYSLVSTIGEPAAGTVSNGEYRITSGFPATIGGQLSSGTSIVFKDSFEGTNTGGCTP